MSTAAASFLDGEELALGRPRFFATLFASLLGLRVTVVHVRNLRKQQTDRNVNRGGNVPESTASSVGVAEPTVVLVLIFPNPQRFLWRAKALRVDITLVWPIAWDKALMSS